MAEETKPTSSEEVVVAEAVAPPPEEKSVTESPAPTPVEEPAKEEAAAAEEEKKLEAEVAAEESAVAGEDAAIPQSVSFKEESNLVSDLDDPEKKALDELKQLVLAAIANNEFVPPPPPPPPPPASAPAEEEAKPEEPKKEEAAPKPAESEEPKSEETTKPAEPEEPKTEKTTKEVPFEESAPTPPPPGEVKVVVVEVVVPKKESEEPKSEEPPKAEPLEEKAVVVDEDGAKTVEAIEETVIAVSASTSTEAAPEAETTAPPPPPEEVLIWGIPLVGDERSDTILLKFLRARDFKVKDAMAMIKNAVIWRKQFGIDALLEEDLGFPEMDKVVFTHGVDQEGHPVCYNVYGEFQNKELYDKAFGDEEKRQRFLKWRIQYLEKGIRSQLDFSPGGVSSMVQVTDLKNSPSLGKHRQVTKQALTLLQDNYPEFIAKKVFINVPWWYLAVNRMMSTFLTQRTKSKFVLAGPSKSAETLFKYIAPAQVPVQFGGLGKENDPDFTTSDAVTEVTIKPSSKQSIDVSVTENSTLVWELRVLGWDVSYGAEFVPSAEDGYTVIVQKARKLVATDEPVVKATFKVGEPGKVVLTVDNLTSKKKKLLYRTKVKSSTESI
ncbi:patellin-3-like [Typha latifolia]|uniref:patellin-3-like n=1 Tax=Typha latifolia TaxID=4733 RepID=UPI003C2FE9E0